MISIRSLDEKDLGKYVIYRPFKGAEQFERGRIKCWTLDIIFVVYKCDNQWDLYENYTAQGTRPEDLEFE